MTPEIDPEDGDYTCPLCEEPAFKADSRTCEKCGEKVCDACAETDPACGIHTVCSDCEGENDCPVCSDIDEERAETLDVIRRA